MTAAYLDLDNFDVLQDLKSEQQPYLDHTLSFTEVMDGLLPPDAVSRPVAPVDPGAQPSLPAPGSQEPTHQP